MDGIHPKFYREAERNCLGDVHTDIAGVLPLQIELLAEDARLA